MKTQKNMVLLQIILKPQNLMFNYYSAITIDILWYVYFELFVHLQCH